MDEIIQYIDNTGKYESLIARWNEQKDEDIRFEIFFAYWCEQRGLTLCYELNINSDNDESVDFQFITDNDGQLHRFIYSLN